MVSYSIPFGCLAASSDAERPSQPLAQYSHARLMFLRLQGRPNFHLYAYHRPIPTVSLSLFRSPRLFYFSVLTNTPT